MHIPVPMDRRRSRCRSARYRSALFGVMFSLGACLALSPVAAQPRDPRQTIGPTVADAPSAAYRFERFVIESADGRRRWRVTLGIALQRAPRHGFSALYMLDGNAALMEFDQALLAELARGAAPVLVFIGHDNDLRIDTAARTRDYTPSAALGEGGVRSGGGADAFAEAIVERIQPEVRRRVPLDRSREAVWGHSFGGLFVLNLLYTHGDAFATWLPASPSLWWDQGMLLGAPERGFFERKRQRPVSVLLMQGERERRPDEAGRDRGDPRVAAHLARIAAAPADATQRLAERLDRKRGAQACYRSFAGLDHGPMLRASVRAAAQIVAADARAPCRQGQAVSQLPKARGA
ncbi:alpha/beta hydrolase [Lysobacter sp. CA199]|uniref:alpha/beta hydrolase n=1 Tax=Lysobacter sp. CA199 TaxID=3455608 RepID=UPI003F8CFE13